MGIAVIGSGNLAWNLVDGLRNATTPVVQVLSRNMNSAVEFRKEFGIPVHHYDPSELSSEIDLVIIAVSDQSISAIAQDFAAYYSQNSIRQRAVFAHTSGSMALSELSALNSQQIGVFYPLQTFTKGISTQWSEIPIFLETLNDEVHNLLQAVAYELSSQVSFMNSQDRLKLHLGAVFASNYANFMWFMAEETGQSNFEYYKPLILEQVRKSMEHGPFQAMTGPARRGDLATLSKHKELLSGDALALYQTIADMIESRFDDKS